jgi:SnoaL-like domain
MEAEAVNAWAQQFVAALHALDQSGEQELPRMLDLFSNDVKLTNAALKAAGIERRGVEGARSFWRQYCYTLRDASTNFHAITLGKKEAGLFWTSHGKGPDGNAITYDGATLLRYNDGGKINAFHGYYDTRELSTKAVS